MGFLVIRGDVISCMGRFSVSVTKISISKFPFYEDVNSWWCGGGGELTSQLLLAADLFHKFTNKK